MTVARCDIISGLHRYGRPLLETVPAGEGELGVEPPNVCSAIDSGVLGADVSTPKFMPMLKRNDFMKFLRFGIVAEMRDQATIICWIIRAFIMLNWGSSAEGKSNARTCTADRAMSGRRNENATTTCHLRLQARLTDATSWKMSASVSISDAMSRTAITIQRSFCQFVSSRVGNGMVCYT